MSVFKPATQERAKVPNSQYIKTESEDKPEEPSTQPSEPVEPEAPKA